MAHDEAKTHPAHRASRIARPVDPRHRTNLAILVLAPLVGAGAGVLAHLDGAAPMSVAVAAGLATLVIFLTWALGREIAPDENAAAFAAVLFAAAPLALGAGADLWTLVLALGLARVVNRTVGPPAFATDLAVIGVLVLIVAVWRDAWIYAFVAALAFVLDAILERPKGLSWFAAAWALMIGAAVMWWGPFDLKDHVAHQTVADALSAPVQAIDIRLMAAVLVASGAAVFAAAASRPPRACCDFDGAPLDHGRVAWGAIVIVLCGLASVYSGEAGLIAAFPIWAVIAGGAVGRLFPDPAQDPTRFSTRDDPAVAVDLDAASGPSDEIAVSREHRA